LTVSLPFWRIRLQSLKNERFSREKTNRYTRYVFWGTIGLCFWAFVFFLFYRVLNYFRQVEILGDILAMKLLYMIIVTCFGILILSNLIIMLSKLYLARDLNLVFSLPLSGREIFVTRFWETVVDASWMVLLFGFPIFLSYGIVYKSHFDFYLLSLAAMGILCVIASGISAVLTLLAGAILPAGRLRAGLSLVTVLAVVAVVVAVRLLRPEQLVNPDRFMSVAYYLSSLKVSSSPLLPTTWAYDAIRLALRGGNLLNIVHNLALSITGAATLVYLGAWLADKYLRRGFSRAEMVKRKVTKREKAWGEKRWPFIAPDTQAFFMKEFKTFLRDQSQWPQLVLVLVLIGIYLYNFSVLPLDKTPIKTVYLQNVFSFLNIGLAAFVLTAIAARFVYPALSLEGKAFWIVLSAPTERKRFIRIKFFFYLLPLLLLSEMLIVSSNLLLGVDPLMMFISVGSMLFLVPMITALALSFGALYPAFHHENPVESVTSFGGILYMIVSSMLVVFIIALEAGPVYHLCMASIRRESLSLLQILWAAFTFSFVGFLCLGTVVLSLQKGERHLKFLD